MPRGNGSNSRRNEEHCSRDVRQEELRKKKAKDHLYALPFVGGREREVVSNGKANISRNITEL